MTELFNEGKLVANKALVTKLRSIVEQTAQQLNEVAAEYPASDLASFVNGRLHASIFDLRSRIEAEKRAKVLAQIESFKLNDMVANIQTVLAKEVANKDLDYSVYLRVVREFERAGIEAAGENQWLA